MDINGAALAGIVFFYLFIIAIGYIITYRRHWLTKIWRAFKECCNCSKGSPESPPNEINLEPAIMNDNPTELDANDSNTHRRNDIALAGRSIGLLVGSFTLTAGWVGGSFITGTTESVYGNGLLWTQAPFAYSLSLLFGGLMFAKTMRENNYVTMLDPFQYRYGNLIGGLFLVPAVIAEIFWTLSLLLSLATMLSVVVGLSMKVSVAVSAVVSVSLPFFGGMGLLANTDLIQLGFIFLSLWICIPIILTNKNVGSISAKSELWLAKEPLDRISVGRWLDDVIYLIFGGIPWQTYFQKILSCKSTKVARNLSYTTFFFCLMMSIPPVLIGIAATTTDWGNFNLSKHISNETAQNFRVPIAEYALPAMFVSFLPAFVLFLCMGSLAACTISSTNSSILSASTMIAYNLYKNIFKKNVSSRNDHIVC